MRVEEIVEREEPSALDHFAINAEQAGRLGRRKNLKQSLSDQLLAGCFVVAARGIVGVLEEKIHDAPGVIAHGGEEDVRIEQRVEGGAQTQFLLLGGGDLSFPRGGERDGGGADGHRCRDVDEVGRGEEKTKLQSGDNDRPDCGDGKPSHFPRRKKRGGDQGR